MSTIDTDIQSTPAILQQTLERLATASAQAEAALAEDRIFNSDHAEGAQGSARSFFSAWSEATVGSSHSGHAPDLAQGHPMVFLGCGSSYAIALAAAALYEKQLGRPAQAIMASEYRPRPGWTHLAISRTGQTSELIAAMQQARAVGARVLLIDGEPSAPAEAQADATLTLEFAPEQGIIQTRFISATLLALHLLIGGKQAKQSLEALPLLVKQGLDSFDPSPYLAFDHIVFLGQGVHYGLARLAALNLQETATIWPEAHQTMEYRHGPMAAADEDTLIWSFDPPDDAASAKVLEEARRTGATIHSSGTHPLVQVVQAQHLAVQYAITHGIDPDAPRHIARAVVLPPSEA